LDAFRIVFNNTFPDFLGLKFGKNKRVRPGFQPLVFKPGGKVEDFRSIPDLFAHVFLMFAVFKKEVPGKAWADGEG
jgi:hypothetical protein